ncbi:hypothetical protein BDW71DRAFT_188402 [Aspergillus fruticulosus]
MQIRYLRVRLVSLVVGLLSLMATKSNEGKHGRLGSTTLEKTACQRTSESPFYNQKQPRLSRTGMYMARISGKASGLAVSIFSQIALFGAETAAGFEEV